MSKRWFARGSLFRSAGAWPSALLFSFLAMPLSAQDDAPIAPLTDTNDSGEYLIGPGDTLNVFVWQQPELSVVVPVRPDGKISLPLLNDVNAAGLTPMQLREFLTTALVPYIPMPTVSVIVREVHSFKVTVIGEVKTPGRYELKSHSTVLDVLAMAGGFTEFAARNRIVVLRREATGTRQIPFAFEKLVADDPEARDGPLSKPHQRVEHNFNVEPGDIVLVP